MRPAARVCAAKLNSQTQVCLTPNETQGYLVTETSMARHKFSVGAACATVPWQQVMPRLDIQLVEQGAQIIPRTTPALPR